jgi:Peptidase family M23
VRKLILLVIILGLFCFAIFRVTQSPKPVVELVPAVTAVGQNTPVSVHVLAPKGIRKAVAFVEQNGTRYQAWELPQLSREAESSWNFNVGTSSIPQLKDGKAKLIVEATSNDLLRKQGRWEGDVTVVTRPPTVSVDSDQHYLYLGMADLVAFDITGNYEQAGVRVGDQTFRAWPMPGGKPGLFSLFAYVWNTPPGTEPLVYASFAGGSQVTSPMVYQFPKKEQPKYTVHDLQLDDRFIQKVVGELDPTGIGDPVARFVKINNEMRKSNNKTLSDLRFKTADRFLWSQPFLRQAGAKAEATFADTRNYIYQGKKIDQQVHLGYDLAVTQHVGVQASNDGKVVYAAPLGIYGNCIVVDHGYGLQTIYGHLSRIDVHEGDMVKRGQVMGLSGMTGMAGGDHIHFSMQMDGVQIDPKEWWDPHWIKDHVAKRVPLQFSAAAGA